MKTNFKMASTNSVGNWNRTEDEIILRYVYDKYLTNENMMWKNL